MTNRDQDLIERLNARAATMNGIQPVGAGDTYAVGYYGASDAKLDREATAAITSSATRIAELEARLEGVPSPSPAPGVTFEQWWKASKYRQVIYAGASEQQIARDGWNAALASLSQPAGVRGGEQPMLSPEEEAAIVEDINSGRWPYLQPSSGDGPPVITTPANPAHPEINSPAWKADRERLTGQCSWCDGAGFVTTRDLHDEISRERCPHCGGRGIVPVVASSSANPTQVTEAMVEALVLMVDAFLSRNGGSFPMDEVTEDQRLWKKAMKAAYAVIGQPRTQERDEKLAAIGAGQAVAFASRYSGLSDFDVNGAKTINVLLYPKGTLRPENEIPLYAHPAAPAGDEWRDIPVTDETVTYIAQYGGRCRDCADAMGVCPTVGLPCDPHEARAAIRHVIRAVNYGFGKGFLSLPASPAKEGRS